MPPRHAYWTIIVDDQPTSFRAHDVEELLPTFNRLREKHPSAALKWFERGQLWESREAARAQGFGQGERRWEGPRPDREAPPRDRKWRPGGDHQDPRQKYKDAKKAKWDRYKEQIRGRSQPKEQRDDRFDPAVEPPVPDRGDHTPPHGDPMRSKARPQGPSTSHRPGGDRPKWRPDARERNDRGSDFRSDERRRDDGSRGFREGGDRRDAWMPRGKPPGQGGWPRDSEGRREDSRREGGGGRGWKPKGPPRGGDWRGREQDREGPRGEGWKPKGPPRGADWRSREQDRARGAPGEGWKPKGPPRGGDWRGREQDRGGARGEGRRPKGPPRGADWRSREQDRRGPRGEGWKPKPESGESQSERGDRPRWDSKRPGGKKPWSGKPGGARRPWGSKPAAAGDFAKRKKSPARGPRRPPRGPKKPRGGE